MTLGTVSSKSVSSTVTDKLRDAIQNGSLEPGDRLVERKLADELGVSHIPVREALARLAEEGLIEREPRRGARVAALSNHELEEISSLRTVLEQFVAERAQERWSEKHEVRLRNIVESMISAAEHGSPDTIFSLDKKFHETLWKMADHAVLITVVSQLRGRINGFLRAANAALEPDELITHAKSHADLIDALASGNATRARTEMTEHITIAAQRIAAPSKS